MKNTTGFLSVGLLAVGSLIGLSACDGGGDTTGGGGSGGSAATTESASSTTAGPGGGGGAGGGGMVTQDCETYCTTIEANCTGDENDQWPSKESCLAACAGFPKGTAADMAGNTLGCRIYHAGAAKADSATHCTHAGPGGAGLCGADCEGFCAIAATACTGANEQYADAAACDTECKTFTTGTKYSVKVTSGNSLACRLYHLTVASTDQASADTHCAHIVAASPVCM